MMLINGIKISSPDKILFKAENITKGELAQYYSSVAARMMPYIEERVLSLVVCPQGVDECFYHKNLPQHSHVKTVQLKNGTGSYITEAAGVIQQVQMNTIEFHVWGSKVVDIDSPDIMVFDLDPDEGMNIKQVHRGVMDLKSVLDELGLQSFLKTSGNKGYHILVPFCKSKGWETFGNFAKQVAQVMEAKWPTLYTSNVRKVNRKGRIFIDWIRNGRGATSVAPYSIRAKRGARVSMPIEWHELEKVAPNGITIHEAVARSKKTDPWARFFSVQKNQTIK